MKIFVYLLYKVIVYERSTITFSTDSKPSRSKTDISNFYFQLEPWDLNPRVVHFSHLFIYVLTRRNAQCTSNVESTLKVSAYLGFMTGGKFWWTRWKLLHPGWNPSNWDCGGRPPKGSYEGDFCVVLGIHSNWKTTSWVQRTKPCEFCEISVMGNGEVMGSYKSRIPQYMSTVLADHRWRLSQSSRSYPWWHRDYARYWTQFLDLFMPWALKKAVINWRRLRNVKNTMNLIDKNFARGCLPSRSSLVKV